MDIIFSKGRKILVKPTDYYFILVRTG
ncbi:hypothetical protein Gohar_011180 [Gossypium harknessii]|uniref:Uncharacterized protein n=1 Tax=Gossypium harknessii TaxID=34285 RepID=A0A7J9GUK8_9ROSI|nr:hypothetical protein [Gossypium harknessii]